MPKHLPPPAPKGNKRALGNHGGAPATYTEEWLKKEAQLFRKWMQQEDSIYFKSFAIERGYHPNRLQEFADKNPEFSGVYNLAKAWQEQKLVNYGLFNKTNSGMTKFVLANHHGYVEKTQVSGDSSSPVSFLLTSVDGKSKDLINKEGDEQD
jgi:hypothetical protein